MRDVQLIFELLDIKISEVKNTENQLARKVREAWIVYEEKFDQRSRKWRNFCNRLKKESDKEWELLNKKSEQKIKWLSKKYEVFSSGKRREHLQSVKYSEEDLKLRTKEV